MTAVTIYVREEAREGGRLTEVTVTGKEVNSEVTDKYAMNATVAMTENVAVVKTE